jgi:hypothetical protein
MTAMKMAFTRRVTPFDKDYVKPATTPVETNSQEENN